MIDSETLFILGSGASKPYGFPTNADLRMCIIKNFQSDYIKIPYTSDFNTRLIEFETGKRTEQSKEFIERLRDTEGTTTIDELISVKDQFEMIGKIAIQYYLLEYERNYLTNRQKNYVSDWFEIVLKEMLKESKEHKNPSLMDYNNVTFITFNYDRLIEFLFIKQFNSLFQELLNGKINKHQIDFFIYKIIHVFGSLGSLPRSRESNKSTEVEFGESISSYERISESISNIGLIKDGFKEPDRTSRKTYNAKKIYFLGVGYIDNNMKMLDLDNSLNFEEPPQIYGTAFQKSAKYINEKKTKFFNFQKEIPDAIIEPLSCKDLIDNYF